VTFTSADAASKAIELNGQDFGGRPIKCELSQGRANSPQKGGGKKFEAREQSQMEAGCTTVFMGEWFASHSIPCSMWHTCVRIMLPRHGGCVHCLCSSQCLFVPFLFPFYFFPFMRYTWCSTHLYTTTPICSTVADLRTLPSIHPFTDTSSTVTGNLSFDIDDSNVHEFFKDCGKVKHCRWLSDKESGQFKGCGFIEFYDEESTKKAGLLNGQELMGRAARIDFAKPRPPREW
jgi:hypothetical protein